MDPTYQAALALLPPAVAAWVATAIAVGTAAVTLCAWIDSRFPQPAEGSRWVPLRRLIAAVAMNRGYAANAVPAGAVPAIVAAHVAEVRDVAHQVEQAAGALASAVEGTPTAAPAPEVRP